MSSRRCEAPRFASGPSVVVVATLALCWAAATVRAEHFDKGTYVPAMEPCLPQAANTTTSAGVPACGPVRFRSDCTSDPTGARRLGAKGRGDYFVRPTGPVMVRGGSRAVDVVARSNVLDVRTCDGARANGNVRGTTNFRMTLRDPACTSGVCRVPEITMAPEVHCYGARCKQKWFANTIFEVSGEPALPGTLTWTAEVTSLDILDAGGRPFVTPGVALFRNWGHAPEGFAADANQWEARMVPSFDECLPGSENTTTSAGRAACAGAHPKSDCATDPAHALHVDPDPHFRKVTYLVRGPSLVVLARAGRLFDCTGQPYTGPLTLATSVRATLEDGGCSGGLCTAVDERVVTPLMAEGGHVDRAVLVLALDPGVQFASLEILQADIQDASGNVVLTGHGLFVRCNPGGLCYGD